jgi:hypothetical protein
MNTYIWTHIPYPIPHMIDEYLNNCRKESREIVLRARYDILSNRTKDELFHLYYAKCLGDAYMKCLKRTPDGVVQCDRLVDEYMGRR